MPEVSIESTQFTDNFQLGQINYIKGIDETLLRSAAERFEEEFIGSGDECVVLGNGDKVIAYSYKNVDPLTAKIIFYKQRIMSTLFPHNFPHFYSSHGVSSFTRGQNEVIRDHKQLSGSVRERIYIDDTVSLKYPMDDVIDACSEWSIPFDTDPKLENFAVGADGGEYYLDTLAANLFDPLQYKNAIDYARENNYSHEDIRIVQLAAERIAELSRQSHKIAA